MGITTLVDLLATPLESVVLDGQGNAWQSSRYEPGMWFAAGSEVEKTAAELLKCGPLRLIHTPGPTATSVYLEGGRLDFDGIRKYFDQAIAYTLRNAAMSSLPDSWRTLTTEQLTDALSVHLLAGLHPVLFDYAVNSGLQVARAEMARAATGDKHTENGARR